MNYLKYVLLIILLLLMGNWLPAQYEISGKGIIKKLENDHSCNVKVRTPAKRSDFDVFPWGPVTKDEEGVKWEAIHQTWDFQFETEHKRNEWTYLIGGKVDRIRTMGRPEGEKKSDKRKLIGDSWFTDKTKGTHQFNLLNGAYFTFELSNKDNRIVIGEVNFERRWEEERRWREEREDAGRRKQDFDKQVNLLKEKLTLLFEKDRLGYSSFFSVEIIPEPESISTLISGSVIHPQGKSILMARMPGSNQMEREVLLDAQGHFEVELDLERPERIHLYYPDFNTFAILFVEPGKYLNVVLDVSKEEPEDILFSYDKVTDTEIITPGYPKVEVREFSGKGARSNRFLYDFNQRFRKGNPQLFEYPYWPKAKGEEGKERLQALTEAKNAEWNYLEDHSGNLSDEWVDWMKLEIYYRYLMQCVWFVETPENVEEIDRATHLPAFLKDHSENFTVESLQYSFWYKRFMEVHMHTKLRKLKSIKVGSLTQFSPKDQPNIDFEKINSIYGGYPLAFQLKTYIGNLIKGSAQRVTFNSPRERPSSEFIWDNMSLLEQRFTHKHLLPEVDQKLERFSRLEEGNHPADIIFSEISDENDPDLIFSEWIDHNLLVVFYADLTESEIELLRDLGQKYDRQDLEIMYIPYSVFGRDEVAYPMVSLDLPGIHYPQLPAGHAAYQDFDFTRGKGHRAFFIDRDGHFVHDFGVDIPLKEVIKDIEQRVEPLPSFWERNRALVFIALINLVFVSLILWVGIRLWSRRLRRRELAKREVVETQLKAIRSQMNPHFLFNSLNAIQNLVNRGESEKANEYLSSFSTLMRRVLHNSDQAFIPLAEELEVVKKYCELEALRMPFTLSLKLDPEIDVYNTEIPGMLIQPHVENAIVHGINGMGPDGQIKVSIHQEIGYLVCTIEDNGIGINATMHTQSESGYGIRLTKDRMQVMNAQTKDDLSVLVTDLSEDAIPGQGTRVEIWVPLEG